MEQSFDHAHFYNSLTQGGEQAQAAIRDYHQLPDLKREAIFAQVCNRASDTISDLLALENANNRAEFKPKKDGLCVLLDSIPALVTTSEERANAIARIQAIDVQSRDLLNMDILMKCDEIETKLKRPNSTGVLMGVPVSTITSIEELENELGTKLPPEVVEKIKNEGGAIILGIRVGKKGS